MSVHTKHKHSTPNIHHHNHHTDKTESIEPAIHKKESSLARLFAKFKLNKTKTQQPQTHVSGASNVVETKPTVSSAVSAKPVVIDVAVPHKKPTSLVSGSMKTALSRISSAKSKPTKLAVNTGSSVNNFASSKTGASKNEVTNVANNPAKIELTKTSRNSFKELFIKKFNLNKLNSNKIANSAVTAPVVNTLVKTPIVDKPVVKTVAKAESKVEPTLEAKLSVNAKLPNPTIKAKKYLNLFNPHKKVEKKAVKKLTRTSLQEYLDKAGFDVTGEKVKKYAFRAVLSTFIFITVIILIIASFSGAHTYDIIIFMLGLWTVIFAGILLLAMACIYFYLDYRIYSRTKEIEEVFPDFLQLASSNISAGMPVDKALWYAIRPNFGVLAKEMEEVAKSTMTGEDLEVSLLRFANKYNSQTIRRSINILIEGMRSGGEMADLLNKIALNIDEMKLMKKEMAANVMTYAIFISFAAVIIAPFLFALATELLTIIIKISGSLAVSSSGSFAFKPPSAGSIESFKIFSVITLVMTAVFSVAIVSIIRHGRIMEGIKSMPLYALVSILIYYISLSVMGAVFGSII